MRNRLAALFLAFALAGSAFAQYQQALPGYRYEFPRDHFDHPDYKTEWWYYTGNLKSADGHRFGFELTFFRQGVNRDGADRWRLGRARHLSRTSRAERYRRRPLLPHGAAQSRRTRTGGRKPRTTEGLERQLASAVAKWPAGAAGDRPRLRSASGDDLAQAAGGSRTRTGSARRVRVPETHRTTSRSRVCSPVARSS